MFVWVDVEEIVCDLLAAPIRFLKNEECEFHPGGTLGLYRNWIVGKCCNANEERASTTILAAVPF